MTIFEPKREFFRRSICLLLLFVLLFFPASGFTSSDKVVVGLAPRLEYTLFLSNNTRIQDNTSVSLSKTITAGYEVAPLNSSSPLSVGGVPNGIAFDPANGNIYVANFGPGTISVINGSTNTIVSTVDLKYPVSPWIVAYNPFNKNIYVSDTKNGAVSIVNTGSNTVVAAVAVGDDMLSGDHDDRPNGIAFNPYNHYMYVAMHGSGFLAEIDSSRNALVANAPLGQNAFVNNGLWGLAFNPANCNFYASNELQNTLTVINGVSNILVASIITGRSPNGVAVDTKLGPNYGNILVANYAANTVSVINGSSNSVMSTIQVGQNPDGIAFDSNSGYFYVANYGDATVSVINGATYSVVSTLNAGSGASGVAYDPMNGNVYVTDSNVAAVSIISTGDNLSTVISTSQDSTNCKPMTTSTTSFSSTVSFSQNSTGTSSVTSSSSITQAVTQSSRYSGSTSFTTSQATMSTNTSGTTTVKGSSINYLLPVAIASVVAIVTTSILALRSRANKVSS